MPYRVKLSDDKLVKSLRRIAREQLDAAIDEAGAETGETLAATVHTVRKRAKKVRGALRLVRPALPAYDSENRAIRDAARLLSPLRDRGTLIEAYDALLDHYADATDRQPYASLRRALTVQQRRIAAEPETFAALAEFREVLIGVRKRTSKWKLTDTDEATIAAGVAKTGERARKATRKAHKSQSPDRLHEWRKRAKYHRYHARLLAPIWPRMMDAQVAEAKRLETLLGDHRDLTLLSEAASRMELPSDISVRATFTGFAERRQAELLAEAFPLSEKLFGEPPEALAARWIGWYRVWRAEG